MLQELVLVNCNVFTMFEGSEDSSKWAFFIDAAVMLALFPLGMTIYIYTYTYIYLWHFNQPADRFKLITY